MGITSQKNDGLAVTAYVGDRTVLLAFDILKAKIKNLAGFAIAVSMPDKPLDEKRPYYLKNRLRFEKGITKKTRYDSKIWTPSDEAPFQSFHWVHYPEPGNGVYTYRVTAMYFDGGGCLERGPSVIITADLHPLAKGAVELGFARTMVSSQAYAQKFSNAPLYPQPQTIEPYPEEYAKRHAWLGAHAREMVMGFLDGCLKDKRVTVDAFTFDIDEASVIRYLCELGDRARVYQDNSKGHCHKKTTVDGMEHKDASVKEPALEPDAIRAMRDAGVTVKTGKFGRLSHNKIFIRRRDGVPEAVLTGSANFTVRGLYVQANSVMIFKDKRVAELYAEAFETAWAAKSTKEFRNSAIAQKWHDIIIDGKQYSFSFAPHNKAFTLDRVKEAMNGAERSVLFAMMQLQQATGPAVETIEALPEREDIYSMGVMQHKGDIGLFKPDTGEDNFTHAAASYLSKNVPPPFDAEISGGRGQVIHHKLVVCDFNGKNPVVFCGSSNLAAGGEVSNSDNLMAIYDPEVAVMFAVETIRHYQHFRFRSLQEDATEKEPLILRDTDAWARKYYETGSIYYRERQALIAE